MASHVDLPSQAAPFPDALPEQALRRYLPADIVATLLRKDCPPRVLFETFAQLASAYYTVSTYLPRHLVVRQVTTSATGPWVEWVEGSLLFADVSGSTALAERLSVLGREGTEIVTGTLNAFFDTMIQVIEAAGGDLLTFGGDALLVLFEGHAHAQIATRTALDLLGTCRNDEDGHPCFQCTVPGVGTFALSMHIGVESGRVALISAGQPASLRYSAMGRTVNSVARAESYGTQGQLVVGPATWAVIAADAVGTPIAEGYVHVQSLRTRDLPPAPLPQEPTIATPPEQAIPLLVRQLDRITPYLPAGLLNRILMDPQRPRVEADLRPVTVLFAQVIGPGTLVETLEPEPAAQLLDTLLRPMQTAVETFGGVVNKLDLADEGDKLLAIFGAPVAYEDHAERAARAALAMFTTGILDDPQVRALVPDPHNQIRLRIGLNTGSVFAGNVGTPTRKEYTVMGDAVNIAARVMAKTPWGEVWCSAATAEKISARLVSEDRGLVLVRGKSEPLRLWRLVGEREQLPGMDATGLPMVGRQEELNWLQEHLDAVQAGPGRVVRISGEAGVGKSRLTAALQEQAHSAGMRVIHVNCLSYANNIPYAPWAEWLKTLCQIEAGDPPALRAEKLSAQLRELDSEGESWLPLLADLVRLDVEENLITRALDAQQRQARRFELLTGLFRLAAGEQRLALGSPRPASQVGTLAPLLVVFEDLHWADQVSLDLWRYVAERISDLPVLLLGVHRPQLPWCDVAGAPPPTPPPEPGEPDGASLLTLYELPPDDSEALIETRLGGISLPPVLREQIITRAAGNPLFLEELLRVVTSGEQPGAADQHQPVRSTIDELPDSLHELLLARIDQLDENSRALLRVAAVIGQRFPFGVLQSIHPHDQRTLLSQLSKLDAEEFTLLEREAPERVHLFRHALVQEVAYQSLLYARRRELHRKVGEYLEKRHAADRKPYYGLLAHHYRLSDNPEKAITYLLLAGHAARDTYANDEAIQYYRWGLEALRTDPTDPRTWETRKALGDVFSAIGHYDEALAEYAAILAVESPTATGAPGITLPPAIAAEARRSRGYALEKQGQYALAIEELRQAETLALAHADAVPPLLLAAIYADMGLVLMRWGEYDRALAVCNDGLIKLRHDERSREDERIEASLHTQLGTIYGMRGDYQQARTHFEHALAAQEEIDDLYGCSRSHNNLGYLWQLQGEYQQAIEHYADAEELARSISAKYVLSSAQLNLAYAYYCLSMYDQAEANCQTALKLCQSMGDSSGIAQVYDTLAIISYNRGNYTEALAAYAQALNLYYALGSTYQAGNTLANTATVYNALSQPVQARELAHQAAGIAEQVQGPQLQVEVLNALAEADLLSAELPASAATMGLTPAELLARSAEQSRRAAALAGEIGSKLDQGIALRLLGQAAARQGEPFDTHFQASLAIFTEIKNRFELARTQARYAIALAGTNFSAAAAYLKQAHATFIEIGAHGELERLTSLSERSG